MRNFLIALHDLLATTATLFAAIYLRFEGGDGFFDRLPLLFQILPYFLAFSVVVFFVFNLTTRKWRFISLPDALNIIRVASVLMVALLVLDYIFVAPNVRGAFFLGKMTIVLYWFLEISFLSASRMAYRYFRYTRVRRHARGGDPAPTLLIGCAADAEVLLRGIESGKIKCIWPVGVLSRATADGGQFIATCRCWGASTTSRTSSPTSPSATSDRAPRHDAVGMRAGSSPESILMRARKLGAIVSRMPSLESGDTPRLTAVAVEDTLLRPSETIDYALLEALIDGKAVIVTCGGGLIGPRSASASSPSALRGA
ncbi:nucleoside-diphosphate sugar epimerase/dehydratase [Bradyrhizobium sp. CCBAU 45384]|uniref:nucleoside-diphosphate sugar epimerase/dehydratase n=1 Tax=Bradyrhizobium sp. CCBAU 45384 TaxID=858428 RepID=UPI003FA46E3A